MDIQCEPFCAILPATDSAPEAKRLRDNLSFSKSGIESLHVSVRGKEKGEMQFVLEDVERRLGQIGKVVKFSDKKGGTESANWQSKSDNLLDKIAFAAISRNFAC